MAKSTDNVNPMIAKKLWRHYGDEKAENKRYFPRGRIMSRENHGEK